MMLLDKAQKQFRLNECSKLLSEIIFFYIHLQIKYQGQNGRDCLIYSFKVTSSFRSTVLRYKPVLRARPENRAFQMRKKSS